MKHRTAPGLQPTPRNTLLWTGLLLTVALFGGWYFVGAFASYGENLEKRALMIAASTAAASLDGNVVAGLSGSADDRIGNALPQVRARLQRIRSAIPDSRFAYLLALRGDEVVFLADAEPSDSANYSPPGQVYAEASATLRQVFATRVAAIEGPLSDRWGRWVSSLVPVLRPKTGELVAVLGIDVTAGDWEASVARYRWLGVAVSGVLAGIFVFIGLSIRRQLWLGAQLATATRIVENSTTILYRLSGAPNLPLRFVSGNISKLGYDADEFLASPEFPHSLVHPDDLTILEESQRRVLAGGVRAESNQFRIRAKDGSYRWVDNRITPVRDKAGRLLAAEGTLVDITERKLADQKIRENETTIHALIEQGIAGIFIADENGKIVYLNPRFAKLLGYEVPTDYLGHSLIDFVCETDKPSVQKAMTDLLSGTLPTIEISAAILAKQGNTVDVLAQSSLTTFHGKPAILGVVMDITERKRAEAKLRDTLSRTQRAEAQLRASEVALEEAQAIAHIGSWNFDVQNRTLTWSKEHYRINELDPATSKPSYEAVVARIHPDDRAAFEAGYANSVANHERLELDSRLLMDDGRIKFVHFSGQTIYDASGRPVRSMGTVQDTTDLKKAEQRIIFANTLLTTEMETSPDGILVVDANDRIISFNRRFAEMWNVPLDVLEAGSDEPVLKAVASTAKDPDAFRARVRYLYEHHEEAGQDEIETNDGRFFDRHTAALRSAAGQYLGRVWFFRDITERKLAEEAVRVSEERHRIIFSSVSDGIFVIEANTGKFIDVNRSGSEMFGYERDELIGSDVAALSSGVPPYDRTVAMQQIALARSGELPAFEWQCKAKDGHLFWVEIAARNAVFGKREVVLSTVRDISERKQAEAQILRMARNDGLTGLANRTVFMEAVQQAIARAKRGGKDFAVLYLDLDRFKDVNDTLGHPVGDELLKAVAERLRSSAREIDTVARFGGDEFAVIAADIGEPADAAILAEALIESLSAPFSIEGNDIRSGASIGISVFGVDDPDAETLVSHADVALYRAKSEDRGGYRFFTEAMDSEVRTRVSLSTELREAIFGGQLFLVYQPQVEIATGKIVGVEALVRWRHPSRGVLGPDLFIPVAEKSGLILALGRWVLRESCRQAKVWMDAGVAPPRMAVNFSAMQFKRPVELELDIAASLAETGLPAERLELELTETAIMEASRAHNDVLVRLRERGIKLAIDDFGTGYSSLDYLRRYPADRIKVAQVFVRQIAFEAESAAITKAIIGIARELGMVCIAEGVETPEQLALLEGWGCLEAQGFYFAAPLEPEEILPHLLRGRILVPTVIATSEPRKVSLRGSSRSRG